jgi:hypothetical protein
MSKQWMAMEHYRLHAVQEWPDTGHKRITLVAIRSTMERLSMQTNTGDAFTCSICASRNAALRVIDHHHPGVGPQTLRTAA